MKYFPKLKEVFMTIDRRARIRVVADGEELCESSVKYIPYIDVFQHMEDDVVKIGADMTESNDPIIVIYTNHEEELPF